MNAPKYRICAAAFLLDFAVMTGCTATPFFVLNQLKGGANMLGVFGALQALSYATSCLVSSGFVSRAKNSLDWAALGVMCFMLLYGAMPHFRDPVLCCLLASSAMASLGLVWPALLSWLGTEPDPKVRANTMSLFNVSWSFGFALSPLFAGPLYDWSYRMPFIAMFGLGLSALLLIRSLPHESDYFQAPTAEMLQARAEHDRAGETYLYMGWCACFVCSALAGITRSVYPKRIDDLVAAGDLRLLFESEPSPILTADPATKYSVLGFSLSIVTALCFLAMGRTSRWHHKFGFLLWIQVAAGLSFWILANTRSLAVMTVCFGIVGAAYGVGFFSGVYYSLCNPVHRHRRAAINEGAVGTGGFVGSIVVGYLAEHYGVGLPFRLVPMFIAAGVIAQLLLLRHGRRKMLGIHGQTVPGAAD